MIDCKQGENARHTARETPRNKGADESCRSKQADSRAKRIVEPIRLAAVGPSGTPALDALLHSPQLIAVASSVARTVGNQHALRLLTLGDVGAPDRTVFSRTAAPGLFVQRWTADEHMRLGDITGRRIDIGGGVELTFGQVVALAGDEFGNLEDLISATRTEDGRAMIRAHLERAIIPGTAASLLPAPTPQQRERASTEYITLAMDNSAHFAGGGTAVENWLAKHAAAIDLAIQGGINKDDGLLNEAYFTEAFGAHFLTDAFSSGHIRVPRQAITDHYANEFAPRVFDYLIDYVRGRLIDEIYDQIDEQTILNEVAWIGGLGGGLGARAYIRREIRNDINARLEEAFEIAGGRHEAVRYLGLGLAGIVAGAMHDMENRPPGLMVISDIDPQPWEAYGDEKLDESEKHKQHVEEAVRASVADLQVGYDIGLEEGQILFNVVEPDVVPGTIYFGFDADVLTPEAASLVDTVADYLNYNPSTVVTLTGHADPIGDDPYNVDLGSRRANRVAQRLLRRGVDPARLSVESLGESVPVTTSTARYHLNRRVEFAYSTAADVPDSGPAETALDNARRATLQRIGPPYVAEKHLPRAAEGLNNELPEWRWGQIPDSLQSEMEDWIKHYLNQYAENAVQKLPAEVPKDTPVGEFTIRPRPIARKIIAEILAGPVGFLGRAMGRRA